MNALNIGVCQIGSIKGDLNRNTQLHLEAIQAAAKENVHYLVFPELSLTGYEPELAEALALNSHDVRLQPFVEAAKQYNMTIAVGAPLATDTLPAIGLFIIRSDGTIQTYAKMNLHPGEDRYFSQGTQHHFLTLNQTSIANAVCADTNNPKHCQYCVEKGAAVYIAGVLITASGYEADTAALAHYAKKHNIIVAMANHNQPTGGWSPIGKSAIWSPSGLLATADESQRALVIAQKRNDEWRGYVVDL